MHTEQILYIHTKNFKTFILARTIFMFCEISIIFFETDGSSYFWRWCLLLRLMQLNGQLLKGLLDSIVCLTRDEFDIVKFVKIGERLCGALVNLLVQVTLVSYQHSDCIGTKVLSITDPLGKIVK